ncbi:J domain-containing protein, partial [Legionella fairfieldensis]|uniref:J domain-containing protein n=1 Tax=Legionella fairfieldensis TaxID=45064 RepID=UPI001040FF1C
MKDFYATLGLTKEASERDIKNAYRKLALIFHTDRGGDGEKIRLINEAYETLSDTEKKHHYDLDWQAYQDADPDARMAVVEIGGYLLRGPTPPYSRAFRAQHHSLVQQYKNAPLKKRLRETIVNFESSIYQVNNFILSTLTYHDIFSFLRAQANQSVERTFKFQDKLTPILAIKLFINFLAGDYYGSNLRALKQYLRTELKTIKSANKQASEVLLFEGISELVFMTNEEQVQGHALLSSLKKITDFSKKAPTELMPALAPLFYNKYFRNLHAYALHLHWHSSENLFDADYLKQFNGYEDARELLSTLKEKLGNNSGNKQLSKLIRYVKLLFNAEETVGKFNTPKSTASELRKGAFLYLDWIPVFMDKSSKEVLVNIFLQIGIRFQHASRLESQPALKMADERLAMKMYLTAGGIANHSTPDIEIYANTHIVKYLSDFKFEDETLTEVIPALKKRTLFISDVFPFFEKPQSTIAFLKQENQTLHLMRHLLNAMLTTLEYNKTHADGIAIDHSAATIFYEIYAACVNNWFKKEYDPALEKKFRLELMDELLFDNSWTFLDVEQLINSPWIMIDRDEDGWIKSSRSLPYADDEFIKYRTINGAEVNQKTGEINFFMTPWTKERPVSEKLFTLFDLQQMLEKNLSSAIFSLDPVDPDRPYHPFNALRFSPSQLCESELLNTMLLTDYILKFLTTNQEVQGQYPFDQRSVASMIQHLPAYLRKIIDDFHKAQHTGALHRFWIEAEELDVALSDEDITKQDITRIALGNLKMVVKKHRMERDIYGNLQDVGDEDEGWPIYVLTREQVEQVNSGQQVITGHAMIFIHAATELYYWENNEVIKAHRPENYRETLIRLYIQPRDSTGKVIQNTKNRPLLYRVTREMARQTGLSDRYSSEFIFAHLFTTHYDEFAQYLPEFGRLKELSKIATLIRVLDNMRQSNQESIEALDFLLNGSLSSVPDTSAYRHYYKIQQSIEKQITKSFDKWRKELSTSVLQKKWRNELNRIMSEIGPLTFSSDSTEVNEACKDWLNELSRQNPGISPFRIIREVINPKRAEIAEQLSKSKQASYRRQLSELFSAKLASI